MNSVAISWVTCEVRAAIGTLPFPRFEHHEQSGLFRYTVDFISCNLSQSSRSDIHPTFSFLPL